MTIEPIFFLADSSNIANDDGGVDIDFSFFTTDEASRIPSSSLDTESSTTKKKRNSSKSKVLTVDGEVINNKMVNPVPGANVAETNYAQSYSESTNLTRGVILQADELANEIKSDIDDVRASKTLKNKYTYLTNLTATAGSLLSTKIQAIKEMNSITTQIHNLELNRLKMLKADEKNENDDMRMMDIYSAFVNAPIGSYNPMGNPNIQDLTIGINNPAGSVSGVEMTAMNQNAKPLTAEQNRMRMESNPNIQTVVRYDQTTGQRMFDVIDKTTGVSVPNYPRPDEFLLEDTTIDVHTGIARNRNINTVWPLMINGSNTFITEY